MKAVIILQAEMEIDDITELHIKIAKKADVCESTMMNRDVYDDKYKDIVVIKKLRKVK